MRLQAPAQRRRRAASAECLGRWRAGRFRRKCPTADSQGRLFRAPLSCNSWLCPSWKRRNQCRVVSAGLDEATAVRADFQGMGDGAAAPTWPPQTRYW